MRFDRLLLAVAAVAVLTFTAGNDAQAQSGSRGIGSSVVESFSQGGIAVPAAQYANQYSAPVDYAPAYAPSPGTYEAQVPTQTSGCLGCRGKGRAYTGQIQGGCRNCAHEAPIQTQQDYSAVPSCCGTLGQLDIPSLFTPPRLDRPPVGRAVGRPLFGQWQGY